MAMRLKEQQILDWINSTATVNELLPVWDAAVKRRETLQALQDAGINMERERAEATVEMMRALRASGMVPDVVAPVDPVEVEDYPAWQATPNIPTGIYIPGDMVAFEGKVWEYRGIEVTGAAPAPPLWEDITYRVLPHLNPGLAEPVEWTAGEEYAAGQLVTAAGAYYRVVEDHTATTGLEPYTEGMDFMYQPVHIEED